MVRRMDWLIGAKAWAMVAGWVERAFGLSPLTTGRLLNTLVIVFLFVTIKRLLRRSVLSHIDEMSLRYRISKGISALLAIVGVLLFGKIWFADLHVATYFGIFSAGLAIAMKDPLVNLAGWIFIVVRAPFRVGDRVQLGDHTGDVVDIAAFTFTMLEVGNWVHADQSTGRILRLPNGHVFSKPCANYTIGFEYIWHEIPVVITFESDYERAHVLLTEIVNRHAKHTDEVARQVQQMSDQYRISYRYLTPIVWLEVVDHGVQLTVRYLCHARRRRSSADRLWREILDAFSREPRIDFAYRTMRYFDGRTEGKSGGHPQLLSKPLEPIKTEGGL